MIGMVFILNTMTAYNDKMTENDSDNCYVLGGKGQGQIYDT